MFSERSSAAQYSDEEEDGYDSPKVKRRGASVDDFLKGSELGKQVSPLAQLLHQVFSRKQVLYEAELCPGHLLSGCVGDKRLSHGQGDAPVTGV